MSDSEEKPRVKSKSLAKQDSMVGESTNAGDGDGGGGEVSPGEAYVIFLEMANLSNKLKLLNYEDEYLLKWKMKPLSKHYFAIATNPGEQSHAFISLAAWLIQQAGGSFDRPQEVCKNAFQCCDL